MSHLLSLMTLLVLSGTALAAETLTWCKISFFDSDSQKERFYLGQIEANALLRQTESSQQAQLLEIKNVCWWTYDEDGDISGIIEHGDALEEGTVFLAASTILRITRLKGEPRALFKQLQTPLENATP